MSPASGGRLGRGTSRVAVRSQSTVPALSEVGASPGGFMKKRTKFIILAVMIVLLGVTGYLNVVLNNTVKDDVPTQTTTASYFASYRQDRESRRDQELLYYQAIAESTSSTEEAIKNADEARMALIAQIDKELVVEGLVKGLGFNDCVITMSTSNVNVLIDAAVLTENEVAQVVDIIQQQLGTELKNIKIIPVE